MNPDPQVDPAADAGVPEPEDFWAEILSADPGRVRRAFDRLAPDDAQRVRAHLRRMVDEPGWHPSQRDNARAALRALGIWPPSPTPEHS
jgi:hypothetical protein